MASRWLISSLGAVAVICTAVSFGDTDACSPKCPLPPVQPGVVGSEIPKPSRLCYVNAAPPSGCYLPEKHDVGTECWCKDHDKPVPGVIR